MKKINICFLTDDGYSMPTSVAIKSLIENKSNDTIYDIYILAINISSENKEKLDSLKRNDIEIKIIELDDKYKEFKNNSISASPAAIYKFSIPEILSTLEKVIYLDGDIIIKSDLDELYKTDIGDNYIGAVVDINGLLKRHFKMFIKNKVFYFNSGVMLMNLKKMREDNISKKLIDYRLNGYNELMDQDALNYVLKGKVYELPFIYNTQTMYTTVDKTISQLKEFLRLSDNIKNYDDIVDESVILHYSLKSKPWKNNTTYMYGVWNKYFKQSVYKELELNNKCGDLSKNNKKKISKMFFNMKKKYKRYKFIKGFSRRR